MSKKSTKHRGYYSEVITGDDYEDELRTDTFAGVNKKTCLLWQVKTEVYAPVIKKIDRPRTTIFLAPAERWMTYEEDKLISFPVDTFKPKVQMQHEVEPFTVRRNVAIERLRRKYQSEDINIILQELNIKLRDLLPIPVSKEFIPDRFSLYHMCSFLPLEFFDDAEYDCMTPEDWLNHGMIEDVRHPLPAQAFVPAADTEGIKPEDLLDSLYQWVNVAVTDYSERSKLWSVLTLDGMQREFRLPRLYIMFKAENPVNFGNRIKAALKLRDYVENKIRYEFYCDCMLLTGTPDLDEASSKKIYKLVTRNKNMRIDDSKRLADLESEVQLTYRRAHAEMQFRLSALNDPELYSFLKLPRLPKEKVPEKGRVSTGMKSFYNMRDYFKWMNIYVLPETYRAMYFVVGECLKIHEMNLFTTSFGAKHVTLDEFDALQIKFTDNVIKQLKGQWLQMIVFNIRMCLGDLGKGWFDISQKKYETYEIAKLLRFMELVKHRMQYSLRKLVENSISLYINLVETPCLPCLEVDDDYEWGLDLQNSPFKANVLALFYLQLKMNENGAYYSTNPDMFEPVLLKLYDNALRQTHQIQQVHPFLLGNLRFPKDLFLSSVGLLSDEVCDVRERFLLAYGKSKLPLISYARNYHIHLELFNLDVPAYIEKFKEEQHTASEVKEEIASQMRLKSNLEATLPASIIIGPFFVATEQIKNFLVNKRQEIATKLLDMYAKRMRACIEEVLDEYKLIQIKLNEKPDSIEHIFDIRDWMETVPLVVKVQEDNTRRYVLEYDVLDHFWYALTQEDFDNKWEAIGWPYKLAKQIEMTEAFLKEEEEKFYKIQLNDEFALQEKIEILTVQVVQMSALRDASKTHEIAVDMRRVWKAMKEAQEQGQLLNQRQKLFGMPVVPFDSLIRLIKEFEPYKNLWITASDWLRAYQMWMDNPLAIVDADVIERTVAEMHKMMVKSIRVFADIEAVQKVAIEIKEQIDAFKPLVPIITNLKNPGMRQRHWDLFIEQTGMNLAWTPTITFADLLDIGIENFADELGKLSESATKEYTVEQTLEKMMSEWENNLMELTAYKQTGTYIMKISDEIQQMLDDHLVLTQQISFSPFKGPFEQAIDEWEEKLRITSEVIEEWMDVQKQWMYLEPIFTSEDITKQLPVESKRYNSMERTWRRIMRGARDCPNIILFCSDKKLLESLKDANHVLEVVQKGLTEYLETKRMVFPRLYFLSDDELLEILSQARNPLAVQPHLRKCFENIAKLNFEADLQITQMFSAEDECVDLNPTLYPKGNVEYWLGDVEESMKNTVRTTLGSSLVDLVEKPRTEWVLCWPGQVVIAGSQTFWTAEVEKGITEKKLADFLENVLLANLDGLRSLVKGKLSFLQRDILSALIVIEVHSRDVTQTLVDLNVTSVNEFDWISQLRYYWVAEEMKVRAVNAEFPYGYEYLGNSGRLVITPLTDRCYLTLTGALHLKFGGAPAGPAGTGKTETTKDLAKAMARQCVVFNCSDQLDFMAMGKFFKGLASSGAWACFDEFNRIDIEVLSVVAQQITTIQKAQQARLDRFFFEGSEIVLKESCAVFITMNPGYAGRTELPDNLKALFRPVSMMVPNYTLIAEISLFSFGFSNAKQLANKITTTFKLSSEQLSSQDHYDFGMRAVKTVIAVAGNLKREKPNMNENQIGLRALRDVNVPKFLKDDLKLFNGIVSDLFPRMVEETVDYGILEQAIRKFCLKHGLEDVDDYVKKVIQLYETTVVRHGLMLVGPTGSGKTKVSNYDSNYSSE